MKILLFGMGGQVGWELQRSLAPLGDLVALGTAGAYGLAGDFRQPEAVTATVRWGPWRQLRQDDDSSCQLRQATGLVMPAWQTGVARMLAEIIEQEVTTT